MNRIIKFVMLDILKNKIVLAYTVFLAVFSWSALSLEDSNAKALLTLLNIILLIVPLFSILFSTIYIYNSSEFIELLVSQPIRRSKIWQSLFVGLSLSLLMAYFFSAGIPLLIFADSGVALMMLAIGCIVSVIFVAIAFLASIMSRDKAKGIGIAILAWLYFALLFDSLVLFLIFQFAEYPIEKIMVAITALSPIDLGRILILLHLDVSVMMGYTGAIFKDFFGASLGLALTFFLLLLWIIIPFFVSLFLFKHKDL